MAFIREGSLTLKEINDAEKQIGHKFPDDYKEFLLKTNGGRFDLTNEEDEHGFHVDPIDEEDIWIDEFFGVGESQRNRLITINQEFGEDAAGTLIIGDTLSHGLIVYDYRCVLDDFVAIYFWDDVHAFESTSEEDNVYYIAKDFNELMKKSNLIVE